MGHYGTNVCELGVWPHIIHLKFTSCSGSVASSNSVVLSCCEKCAPGHVVLESMGWGYLGQSKYFFFGFAYKWQAHSY